MSATCNSNSCSGGGGSDVWRNERASRANSLLLCTVACTWTSIRYHSDNGSETKSEEEEQKQNGAASQSPTACSDSDGSRSQTDNHESAAAPSSANNKVELLKENEADSGGDDVDCSPHVDRSAKCAQATETVPAAAAAATQPKMQQQSAKSSTHNINAAPSKPKEMAKRTKSATAAAPQPKKGAAKKTGVGASKPARAAKKPMRESDTRPDVMEAVIGKRKHRNKWLWKVQWKSGTMVSEDSKRAD